MHPLLKRQLKRFLKAEEVGEARLQAFLEAVSEAYRAADDERALLENSLELSSRELEERYAALRADVARREKAESERDAFFRLSPDLLCMVDQEGRLAQVNPSWARVLGYEPEQLDGQPILAIIHPDDRERTLTQFGVLLKEGFLGGFETRCRHRDGSVRWLSWAATADKGRGLTFAIARDITQEREEAREAAQAQKLEAVGQLASGVAHEINTPMQFIGDNVRFSLDAFSDLQRWVEAARGMLATAALAPAQRKTLEELERTTDFQYQLEELPRALGEARDGVKRVAELVRALKEFAHADHPDMELADLNEAIGRTLVLTRGVLKHVAQVETFLGALPPVRCHVGLLSQAFLNLLVNAGHAIEDRQRREGSARAGSITVATEVQGDFVEVRITDDGCGIPEAIRDRIFEPFFTTKEVGRGSGQGLPLVRSVVVDRHGGEVSFESELGVGTTFVVRLPTTAAPAATLEDDAEPAERQVA